MLQKKNILLMTTAALLTVSTVSYSQTAATQGISRQVSALNNTLRNWRSVVESQLGDLSSELASLRSMAELINNNQNSAHACANSRMLFNGSSCISLPVHTASAPPPSSPPPTQTASAPQNDCTASPELCDIYNDVLGRSPDQAGSMFWQDELNRLENSGMTAQQAAAQVRSQIASSNEALTGSMSTQETQNYNNYAQTHQIEQPSNSCSGSTSCGSGGTAHAIEQLYQQELGRSADAGGMEFYSNLVESGQITIEEVMQNLRSSPEAQNN